jgi:hypothetical protein
MAYSTRAHRFLLFGGWDGVTGINQTWILDPGNGTWTQLHPPSSPTGRGDGTLVYDSRADAFVLFGGWHEEANGTYVRLADTWTFSLANDTWMQEHPAVSPSPRSDAMVAYDPAADGLLLFGGFDGAHYLGDLWAYALANDTWWPRPSAGQPSARADGRIVYVESQDRFVLFGGNDYNGPNFTFHHLADTWSYRWESNSWSFIPTELAPGARDYPVFVDDSRDGVLLLTAGYGDRVILNDVWAFNLTTAAWSPVDSAVSPPPRYAGVGGFDPVDGVFVLFSGAGNSGLLNDVWTFEYTPNLLSRTSGFPVVDVALALAGAVALGALVFVVHGRRREKRHPGEASEDAPEDHGRS